MSSYWRNEVDALIQDFHHLRLRLLGAALHPHSELDRVHGLVIALNELYSGAPTSFRRRRGRLAPRK